MKAAEVEMEAKNVQLTRINNDLDNFVYTASHDLRSPITTIEGLMDLLKEELQESNCLNEGLQGVLQRVITSVSRLKITIQDLTEISRLQHDIHETLAEESVTVQEVYEDIWADLGVGAPLLVSHIHTDFQVPQLTFSRKNFRSILYNLLSNAIKYQSPERPCDIRIHTRLEGPYFVLSVKDNGLGMTERQQAKLYTMFKRFHDHVEGTGVGLYMVKRIIENAGGKIEVSSAVDMGTEFRVYLIAA
jgi:signal transduction histidine kinase